MNKRIRELAEQCRTQYRDGNGGYVEQFDEEKFAELIVRECITVSETHAKSLESQPGEPEFEDYEEGIVNGIYEATTVIKKHFGIE